MKRFVSTMTTTKTATHTHEYTNPNQCNYWIKELNEWLGLLVGKRKKTHKKQRVRRSFKKRNKNFDDKNLCLTHTQLHAHTRQDIFIDFNMLPRMCWNLYLVYYFLEEMYTCMFKSSQYKYLWHFKIERKNKRRKERKKTTNA